jgi:hypothetical protein
MAVSRQPQTRSFPARTYPVALADGPASAQQVGDRHDSAGVHQRQGGRPPRLRTSDGRAWAPRKIDQCGDLQPGLDGAPEHECLPKARIQVTPALLDHDVIVQRAETSNKNFALAAAARVIRAIPEA